MDPTDPNVLYATTWQRIRQKWNDPRTLAGYTGSGIHKTTDGGKTWTPINEGLPAPDRRGRIGIDIARSNPNVVYAFVDNYEIAHQAKPGDMDSYGRQKEGTIKGAEIYRSDNKGQTWRKVSESNAFMEGAAATYGWVFSQIRVDPTNENVVYFQGLMLNQSTDGGKTFKVLRGMHTDHHALWIDPANPDNLIDGNDGGVVMSYDGGKTWRLFTDNLPVATFFNVEFDNGSPLRVYGSVQDHGSYRAVVDLSKGRDKIPTQAFEETLGGEGTTHAIDKSDNNTIYASSFYGNLDRADLTKPGRPTRCGTTPFEVTNIMPKAGPGEPSLRGQWMAPTIVSPHDPNVVYHGLQYVFRSMHQGDTWERISPDLTGNDPKMFGDIPYQTLFALAESPMRFGLIYAGTDDGRLCDHAGRREGVDRADGEPAAEEVDLAHHAVGLRRGHGLRHPEREARRRVRGLHLQVHRLRQDVQEHRRQHPVRAGERDPRGSDQPEDPLRGDRHGRVRDDRRRRDVERARRQPAAGVRARPEHPAARPDDCDRDARPGRVADGCGAGAE